MSIDAVMSDAQRAGENLYGMLPDRAKEAVTAIVSGGADFSFFQRMFDEVKDGSIVPAMDSSVISTSRAQELSQQASSGFPSLGAN